MKRVPLQSELPLPAPRRRVVLIEDTETVTLRVPAETAKALEGKHEALTNFMARGAEPLMETVCRRLKEAERRKGNSAGPNLDVEDDFVWALVGLTDWMTGKPWCSGYWDINNGISEQVIRRWYDAAKDEWRTSNRPDDIRKFPFTADLRWRGLKAPAIGGYTYRVPGQRVRLIEEDQS